MSEPDRPDPLAVLPEHVRHHIAGLDPDDIVEDPYRLTESPADVQARRDARAAWKARLWTGRVPMRFRSAALADLTTDQCADTVRAWATGQSTSGAVIPPSLTLVIQAEEPGIGKSHAAYAVGNHAVEQGAWAMAWTMVEFNDAIRPGGDDTAYHVAQECDLLVLDDMGREKMSDWTLERLQGVVDARWSNEKRTVVTTNLPGPAFVARYGEPVVDRLTDRMVMVKPVGNSRRKPAPW